MKLLAIISLLALFGCGSYTQKERIVEPGLPEASRNMENIRLSLQKAKKGIYPIYLDHRKRQLTAKGKFLFSFTINPSGNVESLQLIKSDIEGGSFIENILNKIQSIDFGPEEVKPTKVEYTFIFMPN